MATSKERRDLSWLIAGLVAWYGVGSLFYGLTAHQWRDTTCMMDAMIVSMCASGVYAITVVILFALKKRWLGGGLLLAHLINVVAIFLTPGVERCGADLVNSVPFFIQF